MATPTSLPASFTAGQVLTAAQMNNLRGAFRVLQVVTANTENNSGTTVSTTAYTATGLTATITPTSTSSKILILVSQANRKTNADSQTEVQSKIYRGATALGSNFFLSTCYTNAAEELRIMASLTYLDSPATTSATTYTMYGAASAGTASFDFYCSGSMILMEISA